MIQSKPTLEGAGVYLRRAFGFGDTKEFDPFLLLDDFPTTCRRITWQAFHGTRIAESKRSLMCWPGQWSTETAWETAGVRFNAWPLFSLFNELGRKFVETAHEVGAFGPASARSFVPGDPPFQISPLALIQPDSRSRYVLFQVLH
jgi:hypothetical protein